jgi:hypothetical protein
MSKVGEGRIVAEAGEAGGPGRQIRLELNAGTPGDVIHNLSAATRVANTLFLGSDEGVSIERLERDGEAWTGHVSIPLGECLDLNRAKEADIEGLAEDDGWLWVLGSHARTRPKIGKGHDEIDLAKLADLNDTRPRCLLARLPLSEEPGRPGILRPVARDGDRKAGLLRQSDRGNALAKRLARDPLFKPFTKIPAKEGGVDLEGIAAAGPRLAIGMRGPVIRTYAVLLEIEVRAGRSGKLKLHRPLRRRLLDLEGLGIRDLKRHGADLLILAGPTTGLDGPCALHRWSDWLHEPAEHDEIVRLHRPERILDIPFGEGCDHPEGLALLPAEGERAELLVICDSPSPHRVQKQALTCDLIPLPSRTG